MKTPRSKLIQSLVFMCALSAGSFQAAQAASQGNIDQAEAIARDAEYLVTPASFMQADAMFDQALKLDSSNKRAQFYKQILSLPMAMKGFLKRSELLIAKQNEHGKRENAEFARAIYGSALHGFLYQGVPNIINENGMQKFLDTMEVKEQSLRQFISKNKNLKLSLTVTQVSVDWNNYAEIKDYLRRCSTQDITHAVAKAKGCDRNYSLIRTVTLDAASLEAMQHAVAGLQVATILSTAYDLTGTAKVNRAIRKHPDMPASKIIAQLKREPEFGKIRNGASLKKIVTMASDFEAGALWANKNRDSICRLALPSSVITKSLCYSTQNAESRMAVLGAVHSFVLSFNQPAPISVEDYTNPNARPFVDFGVGTSRDAYVTAAYLGAPLVHPVASLKTLLPTTFNSCGSPTNVGEPTLGGIFPNRDADIFLAKAGVIDHKCKNHVLR